MWFALIRFLIQYILLPSLVIAPATVLATRNDAAPEIQTFAATASGGNTLLWILVIGLVINALVNAKIPQLETFKAWLLAKLAGWLAKTAEKMQQGVAQ